MFKSNWNWQLKNNKRPRSHLSVKIRNGKKNVKIKLTRRRSRSSSLRLDWYNKQYKNGLDELETYASSTHQITITPSSPRKPPTHHIQLQLKTPNLIGWWSASVFDPWKQRETRSNNRLVANLISVINLAQAFTSLSTVKVKVFN
jgi:hypothetical protein